MQNIFGVGIDFFYFILYNVKVITVTETVAVAKAQREAAFGASRKRLTPVNITPELRG